MLTNVQRIVREECRLAEDRLTIVGVSGGADSLCLMQLLRQAGLPILVAHFDHQLRDDSAEDARVVEQIATRLSVPFRIGRGDVRAHATRLGLSIEEAGRNLRYGFLFEAAREHAAQAVAVGHTADDQVETVLMHFLRGAGLSGLTGMSYRTCLQQFDATIPLVRPLLDTWRTQTEAFCVAEGLAPILDLSNESLDYARNRLRHRLIPAMEDYNAGFRGAVWRTAKTLGRDHELLAQLIDAAWNDCAVRLGETAIALDAARLRTFSPGLRQNVLRRAVQVLDPQQELDFAALARASDFVDGLPGAAQIDLKGGLRLYRDGGSFILGRSAPDAALGGAPQLPGDTGSIPVSIPGQIDLLGGWRLTCEVSATPSTDGSLNAEGGFVVGAAPYEALLDAAGLPPELELRARRPGDRFQPLGMAANTQRLSEFMVNEKMPARARRRWPLLCARETVIWVPGYRLAHPFRITPGSESAVLFRLERRSGS
jgi:tRNA(Ile)-lysidine synthase